MLWAKTKKLIESVPKFLEFVNFSSMHSLVNQFDFKETQKLHNNWKYRRHPLTTTTTTTTTTTVDFSCWNRH